MQIGSLAYIHEDTWQGQITATVQSTDLLRVTSASSRRAERAQDDHSKECVVRIL